MRQINTSAWVNIHRFWSYNATVSERIGNGFVGSYAYKPHLIWSSKPL